MQKPQVVFLLCGILVSNLLIIPSIAEEGKNTEEPKLEEKTPEPEIAATPAATPAPEIKPSTENPTNMNLSLEEVKRPITKPKPPFPGRTCFICANCPQPLYFDYCGGMSKFCYKSEWKETGEIMRGCAKPQWRLFSMEENQTCSEFTNGVKVCYCENDLCNGAFLSFSLSSYPPLVLLLFGVILFHS